MFAPATIYKDLMRLVHPDLHPMMSDATVKAQQVNAVKKNPEALKRLAMAWGFIGQSQQRAPYTWQRAKQPWEGVVPKTLFDMGLYPNSRYILSDIAVRIRLYGQFSTHRVVRTTAKCVVVLYGSVEKIVQIKNIVMRVK